ncbi:hypothetical protein ACWEDZ_38185, partial [Streptomyces sp. NPDC005047]
MTDSDGDEGEAEPKLCDLCVAMVVDSTELYAGVPDSLSIHAVDPKLDSVTASPVVSLIRARMAWSAAIA